MPKISFNAQALGIASYDKRGNVSHAKAGSPSIPIVSANPSIQALFEGLGFTNVESFPTTGSKHPTEDVDP